MRTETPRLVVDPTAPCRACRARTRAHDTYHRRKAQYEAEKAAEREQLLKDGKPIPITLLTTEERRSIPGGDPCLEAVRIAIASARSALCRADLRAKEGVRVTAGNTERKHPFYLWLSRLLQARIAVYEDIRDKRRQDMQNHITRNDVRRHHMLWYVSDDDRALLDEIAAKVNFHAPPKSGPKYTGLTHIGVPRVDKADDTGRTRADTVVAEAWKPFIEAIRRTKDSSHAANRNRYRNTSGRRPPTWMCEEQGIGSFTIEQYHIKRILCAELAMQQIDRALIRNMHPTAWVSPWDNSTHNLRTWRDLVVPSMREEMLAMHRALTPARQKQLRPFPMLSSEKRLLWQIDKGLDSRGLPMVDSVERDEKWKPEPRVKTGLPIVSGRKRKPVPVYQDEQGNWRPVPSGGHEDGLETNFIVKDE